MVINVSIWIFHKRCFIWDSVGERLGQIRKTCQFFYKGRYCAHRIERYSRDKSEFHIACMTWFNSGSLSRINGRTFPFLLCSLLFYIYMATWPLKDSAQYLHFADEATLQLIIKWSIYNIIIMRTKLHGTINKLAFKNY